MMYLHKEVNYYTNNHTAFYRFSFGLTGSYEQKGLLVFFPRDFFVLYFCCAGIRFLKIAQTPPPPPKKKKEEEEEEEELNGLSLRRTERGSH